MSEYYRPGDHDGMTEAAVHAFIRVLAPFSRRVIRAACDQWRREGVSASGKPYAPASANLHQLAEAISRREREAAVSAEAEPDRDMSPAAIAARRIRAREPVAASWLSGQRLEVLRRDHGITDDDLAGFVRPDRGFPVNYNPSEGD